MPAQNLTEMELNAAAVKAMAANAPARAKEILQDAIRAYPKSLVLRINLAAAHQALSDLPAALLAVGEALKIAPRSFSALLFKATLLEKQGRDNEAALAYGDALTQAPPENQLDAGVLRLLRRAREVHQQYVAQLGAYVRRELGAPTSGSADSRRMELFIDASLGTRKIFRQEPSHFRYPELPAIEFYEREEFPWLADLESATADMRAELAQVPAEVLRLCM
jgi:tetratricopeptide (TPR) repeat protein